MHKSNAVVYARHSLVLVSQIVERQRWMWQPEGLKAEERMNTFIRMDAVVVVVLVLFMNISFIRSVTDHF